MSELELKRLNELVEEIILCGEIWNDPNWENLDEWNELIEKKIKYEEDEL